MRKSLVPSVLNNKKHIKVGSTRYYCQGVITSEICKGIPLPPFSVGSPYTFTWKSRSEQTKQRTLNSTQSATPLGNGEMGKTLTVRETFYGKQPCMWGNSYCQGRMTLHWLSQQIITKFSIFILLLESIV